MHIRTKNVWPLVLAVFVMTACVPRPAVTVDAPSTRAVMDGSYILGPGDELKIVVFNHEDLSTLCVAVREVATPTGQVGDAMAAQGPGGNSKRCAVVGEAGMVSLPLVGEIRAAGRTVEAVRQEYADRLADGYLVSPHVTATIKKNRPFFIIGGVKEPGAYEYQADLTIAKAIALAGGLNDLAIRGGTPRLLRASGAPSSRESTTLRTTVFPGDVVEIPWVLPLTSTKKLKPGKFPK